MQEWLTHILELIKEISLSLNVPYIDFGFTKATPALVFSTVYVLLLVIAYYYNVKKNRFKLQILQWKKYSEGRKMKIQLSNICGM